MADSSKDKLTDQEIESLNVVGLKNYLKRNNQYVTGNKEKLIERAKGVGKLNLTERNVQKKDDERKFFVRKCDKLVVQSSGERFTDPVKLVGWTTDVTEVPNFSISDIYNYLVVRMGASVQMRSKVYYEDRHVHSVQYHGISEEATHCFVKCKVIPSSASSNLKDFPDHTVWLCLAKVTGQVLSADCSCTAGGGEACNHIAGLMYVLAGITLKKNDGTLASTSKQCLWSNPRKRKMSPKKSQELQYKKYNLTVDTTDEKPKKVESSEIKSVIDEDRFKSRLEKVNPFAGWLTFFETDKEVETIEVKKLLDVTYYYCDHVSLDSDSVKNNFESICNDLNFTKSDCERLEQHTRGQSTCAKWKEERSVRITSSHFGSIVNRKVNTQPDKLLHRILYEDFDNKYLQWGKKHEPAARMRYRIQLRKDFSGVKVTECGLFVSSEWPFLGASPDGVVSYYDDGGQQMHGVLEIKCPASDTWKMLSPIDCCQDPTFYCAIDPITKQCRLKRTHKYYFQVQGQLAVTGRTWCDFVIWTLKGFSVERIFFDAELWSVTVLKLKNFYIHAFLPELFSRRVKRGLSLF